MKVLVFTWIFATILWGCGARSPKASDDLSAGAAQIRASHSTFNSCTACHSLDKPTAHPQTTDDCVRCHKYGNWKPQN